MAGIWMRPISPFEKLRFENQGLGEVVIVYWMTIQTQNPIHQLTFYEAFQHLQKKTPTLKVKLKNKDNERWFYETLYEIDFQYMEEANPTEEYHKLLRPRYDLENGPLWCGKVIQSRSDSTSLDPIFAQDYPHQYHILLGLSHGITDGFSNMLICSSFISILDDLAAGNSVYDHDKLAPIVKGNELHERYLQVALDIQNQVKHDSRTILQVMRPVQATPILLKHYPPIGKSTGATLALFRSFTRDQTSKFMNLCKQNNVTVNSGVSSLIDLAVHRMVKTKGSEASELLTVGHMVNMRRFWNKNFGDRIGLQTGFMVVSYNRKLLESISTFWIHAKQVQEASTRNLQSDEPFKFIALLYTDIDQNEIDESSNDMYALEYLTTNMGNLNRFFKKETTNVKIVDLNRSSSLTVPFSIEHTYHTLNGRLIYSVDYLDSTVSTETMKQLVDIIFVGLNEILKK